MDALNILQVVGYKNSGKTTLIQNWLRLAERLQLRAAVIKHHGHGGPLELPPEGVDSMKFLTSGAVSSISCSTDLIQMHMQAEPKLSDLIELAARAQPDIIFVEGFKGADKPKVVIVRMQQEWESLRKLTNIRLVLVYDGTEVQEDRYPVIPISDRLTIEDWIIPYLKDGL